MALAKFKSKIVGRGVKLSSAVVAGTTANTLIAVAGLSANAQLVAVFDHTGGTNLLATTTVVAGGIKNSTVTTGKTLLVIYAQLA